MMKWMQVLMVLCLSLLGAVSVAAEQPLRLLLDEEFSWMTKADADKLVADASRAGFNVLVPCVWHGRGVTWNSNLPKEPRWADKPDRLVDPLGYLIQKAHDAGLEVHPWFTLVKRQRNFYPEFAEAGVPDDAFDVHNIHFRRFIRDVVLEVVAKYPVDGINLDYVRSRGICASKACRDDYAERTGRNLATDSVAQRVSSSARRSIESWNAEPVLDLVTTISAGIRASKPAVIISVSSHAGYEPLLLEGANSIAWANAGLVDYILHIEYAKVGEMRKDLLATALSRLKRPSRLIMIAGNYEFEKGNKSHVWPREAAEVANALRFAITYNPAQHGAALYEYRFMNEAQIQAIAAIWESQGQN